MGYMGKLILFEIRKWRRLFGELTYSLSILVSGILIA